MSKDKPLVSILLATYNGSRFIRRAIQSVFEQTFGDYELIVIDDCSNDGTVEILKEFENEERVIRLRNEMNLGYQRSLNGGLHEARGEYIAIIDDDDRWLDEDKLRKQVEFLDTHPEHVLVGTGMISVDEEGIELSRTIYPERDEQIRDDMLVRCHFAHSSVMYRKSEAIGCGGYSEKRHPYDEYDLWLKLGVKGKLANLPIYGLQYTYKKRGILFVFGQWVIFPIRTLNLIGKYKGEYPHYWRAVRIRFVRLLYTLLRIVSDVPPFIYLKGFLKNKCPTSWRVITYVHNVLFQGIFGVIRLSKRGKSRTKT